MLFDLIGGKLSTINAIVYILSALVVIFLTMPIHEFAHSFAAYKLGDRAQRYSGRLTLNPFAHIDYVGALSILLVGFGWAKPVSVNPYYFKNKKVGMAATALAGPLANLVVAFLSMFFCNLLYIFLYGHTRVIAFYYIALFFNYVATINISLAVFNLIPLPPLDGSKILMIILPDRIYFKVMEYERYIYFILLILLITGAISGPIGSLTGMVYNTFNYITALPFTLIS